MKCWHTALVFLTVTASGQTTLQTNTTLVLVPALVQTSTHDLAFNLTAKDFSLTDNGVPQKLTLEDQSTRPLALVVLIQTGGAARGQLDQYSHLDTMLREVLGPAPNQVSIVNFDSQPEGASPFTTDIAEWQDAIDHPDPGDNGAAIFDSLAFALHLFQNAPAGARHVILLISQSHDEGSKIRAAEIASDLGETGTALYSLTFSAERSILKQDLTRSTTAHPPITVAGQQYTAYFELTPVVSLALGALQKNAAATLAGVSGGEAGQFTSRGELEAGLNTLANHLRNTYVLSFTPVAPTPGTHTLALKLDHHPELQLSSRTQYAVPPAAKP